MNNCPTIYTLENLRKTVNSNVSMSRDGRTYHPARPLGFYSIAARFKAAWLVFTGRADAVIWPEGQ